MTHIAHTPGQGLESQQSRAGWPTHRWSSDLGFISILLESNEQTSNRACLLCPTSHNDQSQTEVPQLRTISYKQEIAYTHSHRYNIGGPRLTKSICLLPVKRTYYTCKVPAPRSCGATLMEKGAHGASVDSNQGLVLMTQKRGRTKK